MIGLALGVPLAVPLAVLVFLGSFIPFVSALVGGGLVVLVTIGIAFAVGTVLAGILGAIIAVPIVAIIHQAWPALRGEVPRAGDRAAAS